MRDVSRSKSLYGIKKNRNDAIIDQVILNPLKRGSNPRQTATNETVLASPDMISVKRSSQPNRDLETTNSRSIRGASNHLGSVTARFKNINGSVAPVGLESSRRRN